MSNSTEDLNAFVIQTSWKGYRFRSRLEARWAVFFESLRLDWTYEPEGFSLDSGSYLPDFQIHGTYVEIKPNVAVTRASKLCGELSRVTGSNVILIQGKPWPGEYWACMFADGVSFNDAVFAGCRTCDSEIWMSSDAFATPINNNPDCDTDYWPITDKQILWEAYRKARAARFEHGEVPA